MMKTCSMNPLKQKTTMKKNSFLWAALSMTAALVMTACSSDDNNMTEAPVAPSTSKTIPYTVTVGGDESTTRATVDADKKTLRFATGDKLYITGTNIQGVLDLQAGGAGETSNVTFSGELTYDGSGSPADDLQLTATLVSAQQTVGTQVSVNAAGVVTVNYPTAAYCSSINDAVQKYSNLTGTSTYGARAFTLTQQTAFLNFEITFEDGTTTGTELTAVVNNNSSDICSASVTTVTDNGVKAKFVLPVASGTVLSSATVKMGDKEAISFGASQTLAGKIYNVSRSVAPAGPTYPVALSAVTADYLGSVVTTDGNVYATVDDATAASKTAAAVIAYVSGTGTGLAIALSDESSKASAMNLIPKINSNNIHTPAVSGQTWKLPTENEWKQMFSANGGSNSSYSGLNTAITNAGGSALQASVYWVDPNTAALMTLSGGNASFGGGGAMSFYYVRVGFAF